MDGSKPLNKWKDEELVYSVFCIGIAGSLIFWPLLNSILCLLFLAYWLFFSRKTFSLQSNKSRWIVLFCLLYLVVVVGAFYSVNTKEVVFKLQQKSAYLLFPIVIGTSAAVTSKVYKQAFTTFVIATFLGAITCFIKGVYIYFKTGATDYLYGYNLVTALKDMTPFMMSLCCLLALLYLFQTLYELKVNTVVGFFARKSLPWLLIAFFLFIFLFILGNRNILIAASGLLIYYCFKVLSGIGYKVLLVTALLGTFFFAIKLNPFLNRQWTELTDFSKENSIQLDQDYSLGRTWGGKQIRAAIWKCSWDVIQAHWLTGVGTGDVQDTLQAAYEKRKFYFASRYNRYNTHNQYLQEMVTSGIIGLLVFLTCLIAPLFAPMEPQQKQFYCLFILCFAFGCITDTPLELNKGIIWYAFFNALIFFKNYNLKFRTK